MIDPFYLGMSNRRAISRKYFYLFIIIEKN